MLQTILTLLLALAKIEPDIAALVGVISAWASGNPSHPLAQRVADILPDPGESAKAAASLRGEATP